MGVCGPEPTQTVGTAAGLIDAADLPLAAVHAIVRPVLVDPGAETGRAELEGHQSIATEPDDAA